jgi:hypothetical protein
MQLINIKNYFVICLLREQTNPVYHGIVNSISN